MNRVLALLLATLVSTAAGAAEAPALKAGVFSPPHPAPEFTEVSMRIAGLDALHRPPQGTRILYGLGQNL